MKKFVVAALLMVNSSAFASTSVGLQMGMQGDFGFKGTFGINENVDVRAFYYTFSSFGGGVDSIGAAGMYNFTPNLYGGFGMQSLQTTGIISGYSSGATSYIAVGYKDEFSDEMDWNVEYNNFSGISFGINYKL